MKILVISNNCFAKNNSNGRILGCLFKEFKKEDVSQIYIIPGTNDFDLCSNYYLVSDSMLANAMHFNGTVGKVVTPEDIATANPKMSAYRSKYGRSSFTMLCREMLWKSGLWWNDNLKNWILDTKADVVVFQCGDAPFMYDIANKAAKLLNVPIVLFNTEYYYFLNESWMPVKDNNFFFGIYNKILKKKIKTAIDGAALSIYNSDWLKEHYQVAFTSDAEVIYQSSDYDNTSDLKDFVCPKISYVGNLGFGRWEPLVEIAKAIQEINKDWQLDVYGVVQTEDVLKLFEETEGLNYMGTVPYDKALEVIASSDLLILTENQRTHFAKATEYGFSGKITDYLFSGIPVLAYGSISNVGISYLYSTKAAMVVTNKEELSTSIKTAVMDKEWRNITVARALEIANKNHDASKNAASFRNYLQRVVGHE